MMSYWGWGFPTKPIRKNGKMSNGPYIVDETCLVFAKNIEVENERLRAENEKLREELKQADEMLLKQAQTIRKKLERKNV